MWVLEFIIFTLSQVSLGALVMPWSILLHEYEIEPSCMLDHHFQLKLWGTACGFDWVQLQNVHQGRYFAFVNVATSVRSMSLSVAILSHVLFMYVLLRGATRGVVTMFSITIGVISIIAISDYANEMNATMTLPPSFVFIQGPGYLFQLLAAALAGSLFAIEFYLSFAKVDGDGGGDGGGNFFMESLAYITSSMSIVTCFGDLIKIETCPDMVSVFDKNTCPYCDSPLFPLITVAACVGALSSLTLAVMIKFLLGTNGWVVNIATAVSLASFVTVVAGSMMIDKVEYIGYGMRTAITGVASVVVFATLYNRSFLCRQ